MKDDGQLQTYNICNTINTVWIEPNLDTFMNK